MNTLCTLLRAHLENGKLYSVEGLAEKFECTHADVSRAFKQLCALPGWSIRPENQVAYERSQHTHATDRRGYRYLPILNRGRKKGEKYEHDRNESYWERTQYRVRRPEEKG